MDSTVLHEPDNNGCKLYSLKPADKNAIYTTERWSNTLSTGNRVELLYTQVWRSGSFAVELSDLKMDEIVKGGSGKMLKDFVYEVKVMNDGWYECHSILDEDSFTQEELCEIQTLQTNTETENDCEINSDLLEENGWTLVNTDYEIVSACIIRPIDNLSPESDEDTDSDDD
jgi:hypothetical protein